MSEKSVEKLVSLLQNRPYRNQTTLKVWILRYGIITCLWCVGLLFCAVDADAEPKSGIVKVITEPEGATVYLNGRIYGPTPVLIELATGVHSLVISLDGYPPKVQKITVHPDRVVSSTIVLKEPMKRDMIRVHELGKGGADAGPGTVTVVTEPPGLTVLVDDKVVRKKTPVAFDIHSGIYRLKIKQNDQVVVEKTLFVRAGRTAELDFTIKKRRSIDDKDPWR